MSDFAAATDRLSGAVSDAQSRVQADVGNLQAEVSHLNDIVSQALATETADKATIAQLEADRQAAIARIDTLTASISAGFDPDPNFPAAQPAPDTGTPVDTSAPPDTGTPVDTGTGVTPVDTSAPPDTGVTPVDAGPVDTGVDGAPVDGGSAVDTGTGQPAPGSPTDASTTLPDGSPAPGVTQPADVGDGTVTGPTSSDVPADTTGVAPNGV